MQDGNIHCHVDNLTRQNGKHGARIAVASAAYVSGERLWTDVEQRFVTFDMREDIAFSEILLPDGAPAWAGDRGTLWNRVDLTAARKDARLAKTVVAAITRDIPDRARIELAHAFALHFVGLGCVADVAIHEDGTGHNPHLHLLLTTRRLAADGFGAKLVALEQRSFIRQVRRLWADLSNRFLEQAGSAVRVDHRSYRARGITLEPTMHRGPDERERRDKREHARRVREEQEMRKPTLYERREYPLLAGREVWPPEPVAPPGLTQPERDEHHRYWVDRKMDRLEEDHQAEPERPWYEQALERAHTEAGREVQPARVRERAPEREGERDREAAPYDYDQTVRERALAMKRTQEETQVLDAVRFEAAETRKFVQDFILHERMQTVRDHDRAVMLDAADPRLREKLELLRPNYPEWDRDRPVPGPSRELIAERELERAQKEMLRDYERDQERER